MIGGKKEATIKHGTKPRFRPYTASSGDNAAVGCPNDVTMVPSETKYIV